MAKKKKKKDFKKTMKAFFNSAHILVCGLIIIIVILIWFCSHLMNITTTYMFNGAGEYISIYNGIIAFNNDVNVFEGSDITYLPEKDITVIKYEMGYYVSDPESKDYIKLVTKSGNDEEGLSLKGLLLEVSSFNTWEPYQNKTIFPKKLTKNLEAGLVFIIKATAKNGTEIFEEINIDVTKVSK